MLIMIGAFPPPVRGMPMINAAVRARLVANGVAPVIVDLAAPGIVLTPAARARRFLRVLRGLARVARRAGPGVCIYISVSGGFGKVYDFAFAAISRVRGASIYLHHHSFAYLRRTSRLARCLFAAAGPHTRHVVQSPGMADALSARYGVMHVRAVSNAAFLYGDPVPRPAAGRRIRSVGLMSNLTASKGVFDFLELMKAAADGEMTLDGVLAGPFGDTETELEVRARLEQMPNVTWLGPVHGKAKADFFSRIDVFVFPTRYDNETEGIVNHEAMGHGVPVIAYGRGCIPEIVAEGAGVVIEPSVHFVPDALAQLRAWQQEPAAYEQACRAASARFASLRRNAERDLRCLLADLIQADSQAGGGAGSGAGSVS